MADSIKFEYEEMNKCVTSINDISKKYKTAADKLQTDFDSAISTWEGDTGVKMKTFMDQAVMSFVGTDVPNLVSGLATLLQANIEQMQKADKTLSENIPTTLS